MVGGWIGVARSRRRRAPPPGVVAAEALSDLVLDPQQVLTSFPGPAVLLDARGRAVAANRAGDALAGLVRAGVPGAVIHKMLDSRSGKAVTALAWKSGLSARGSMKLQRQVARVPANAMIHARDGVKYALADSEMDWFVTYFEELAGESRGTA